MQVEIITIGDEILIGQTIDTNSAWLGKNLYQLGLKVSQISSIQDSRKEILDALETAFQRADVILLTGGLGPTKDDITKNVLCEYFNTELVINEPILKKIEAFFASRGREMLESNRMQAALPKSCIVLENDLGTASGMWFERDGKIIISLPGVPYEMKGLMKNQVFPRLKRKFTFPSILHKTIMTEGIGESFLVEIIKDWEDKLEPQGIKIAYLPSPGIVKIRLSMEGENRAEMEAIIQLNVEQLKELIPGYFYAEEEISLQELLGKKLIENGKSLSTAESCTGGYLAQLISSIPGSSAYYKGTIVSYSNEIKMNLLGVNKLDIEKYGAVSETVVEQMAIGVRSKMDTDFALATSGVAGPDGGSEEKPVGTVWIALASKEGVFSKRFQLENDRGRNISRASTAALSMLNRAIEGKLKIRF